ncbi:MAG TPA: hypothetical protein VG963_00700 [Polyangiaceae bacterium]|nr:hypothetical protein [Polyangiaceae bacterium]
MLRELFSFPLSLGHRARSIGGSARLPLCCALVFACSNASKARHVYVDSGSLCLRSRGAELQAEVKLLECLSAACNEQTASDCHIDLQNRRIEVRTRLELGKRGADICATDCGTWVGQCALSAPAPGRYILDFGAAHVTLDLPLSTDTQLMPDGSVHACELTRS